MPLRHQRVGPGGPDRGGAVVQVWYLPDAERIVTVHGCAVLIPHGLMVCIPPEADARQVAALLRAEPDAMQVEDAVGEVEGHA